MPLSQSDRRNRRRFIHAPNYVPQPNPPAVQDNFMADKVSGGQFVTWLFNSG